ncbi:MAG: alpha/beta hydrolase [Chitinophagaceae bacterium]|nr:MAG: alpha/beta hydrolase [Chitinophagaceae bacterium]
MIFQKRNNIKITGNGTQVMLFAHGFGCDQNMWRLVAPAFESQYKVVLFDHVGAGHSDLSAYVPTKYAELDGYANDLVDIITEMDIWDIVFVGHSVSAMIGAMAAQRAPERFSSLVMVAPSPCYINDEDYTGGFSKNEVDELLDAMEGNHLGWSMNMAPVIMGNADRQELSAELANSFCRTDPAIARQFARATFLTDKRSILPGITTPTLLLQCSEDIIAPREVGEYMHKNIPGSTLVIMEATGHCPNLSAPAETIAAIQQFLA